MMRGGVPIEKLMERAFVDGKLDMNPFRRIAEMDPIGRLIVTPEELEIYVRPFQTTGFRGGINWYRNIDRNAREHPEIGVKLLWFTLSDDHGGVGRGPASRIRRAHARHL